MDNRFVTQPPRAKRIKIMIKKIEINVGHTTTIKDAIIKAHELALTCYAEAHFKFNGIPLVVKPISCCAEIENYYNGELQKRHDESSHETQIKNLQKIIRGNYDTITRMADEMAELKKELKESNAKNEILESALDRASEEHFKAYTCSNCHSNVGMGCFDSCLMKNNEIAELKKEIAELKNPLQGFTGRHKMLITELCLLNSKGRRKIMKEVKEFKTKNYS